MEAVRARFQSCQKKACAQRHPLAVPFPRAFILYLLCLLNLLSFPAKTVSDKFC
jgi:hypothetical protein